MRERGMVLWSAARGGWQLHPKFLAGLLPGPSHIGHADLCDLGMVLWGLVKTQVRTRPTMNFLAGL